ncbi:molybdate ABC transporter permease subunit [Camelliibacillus cellulosilyticus]|uniref:Molybdenum transport system permease n=1 Tax=Camelliibacillus cellulosilyticus TaxID=2174486 RepID=A0ABV9GM53_9BACL
MFPLFLSISFLNPLFRSLYVALIAAFIALIVGAILGHLMANHRFRGRLVIETLLLMPLVLPPSVVGFGLLLLLGNHGPIGRAVTALFHEPIIFTVWAAMIASTVVAFPLIYLTVKNGFEAVDPDVREAAAIDGANRWHRFFLIDLPLARSSLVTGGLLGFARSMGEFGATLMVAGNIPGKTQTMPTAIYLAVETNRLDLAWGWVISTLILSFILLLTVQSLKRRANIQ